MRNRNTWCGSKESTCFSALVRVRHLNLWLFAGCLASINIITLQENYLPFAPAFPIRRNPDRNPTLGPDSSCLKLTSLVLRSPRCVQAELAVMVTQFNITDLSVVSETSPRKDRQGGSRAGAQVGVRGRAGTAGGRNNLSWYYPSETLGFCFLYPLGHIYCVP